MADARSEHARLAALFASGATRKLEWRVEQLTKLQENFHKHERAIYVSCAKDMGRPLHESMCSEFAGPV